MQGNPGQNQNNQKSSLSWSQPAAASAAKPVKAMPPATSSTSMHSASSDSSHTGTYVGIFVGGLIIGALIGWAITGSHDSGTGSMASSTPITTGTSTNTGSNSVNLSGSMVGSTADYSVNSPQTAGFAVNVTNVKVMQPTWVVVYEDHAGLPGNALGAALFLPQTGNNVQNGTVQPLRATLPGQNYLAGESLDDGDKTFSLASDNAIHDASGNKVLIQFSTQ